MKTNSLIRIFAAFIALSIFGGCHHHGHCAETAKELRIVASTFPVYLFTANICKNAPNVSVSLLIPAMAGCPHDFAPRPQDMQKLAKASALVINGLGLESFLLEPARKMSPGLKIIDASPNVPVLEGNEEHDHADHGHEAHSDVNPHIFAAPYTARLMVGNIADALCELDPGNTVIFSANARAYAASLEALSERLKAIGLQAANKKIALEHEALAYLAQNAALEVIKVIEPGMAAAQLSAARKFLLADKPALLAGDDQYPDRLLKMLARETGIPEARLGTGASGPENAPLDYYQEVMTKNVDTLEKYYAPGK